MNALRLIAFGGLGEIGLNSLLLESGTDRLLVDAGLMFPPDESSGIAALAPDFGYLDSNSGTLRGIFLTHGHEDHVGALAEVLTHHPAPVYGSPLTLALAKGRLEERGIQADWREIGPRERVSVGEAFTLEAVAMAHSVPHALGCLVETPQGAVLHTGDFKLDATPPDGQKTDLERLARAGEEGLLCVLSDSTNSEALEETRSEREVADAFERLLPAAPGRIVLALFSSHLQRIGHALRLCARLSRRVALLGRNMVQNVELAQRLGYLPLFEGLFISPEEAQRLSPSQVALLTTGAQAESRGGLMQLALGERELKIIPGDTVVLSSRAIPGHERAVTQLIDLLLARGARVLHSRIEPSLHASGHASPGQQRELLRTIRPRHFVPIHGELHHLMAHLEVARGTGLSEKQLILARDGDVLSFEDGNARISGKVTQNRKWLDRFSGSEVVSAALRERNKMGELGLIAAIAVVDETRGMLRAVHLSGMGLSEAELGLLDAAREECGKRLSSFPSESLADVSQVEAELRAAIRATFKRALAKRPNVSPQVVKVKT